MKVDQSSIAMQSQHASARMHSRETTLRTWVGAQRPDFEGQDQRVVLGQAPLTLSAQALAHAHNPPPSLQTDTAKADAVTQANNAVRNDPRLRMLIEMIETITGRKVQVFDARELQSAPQATPVVAPQGNAASEPRPNTQPAGWGLEIDTHERIIENENTQVSAQGVVRTADGREINFTLQLQMSRRYVEESSASLRAGDAVRKDPLVINFNGNSAQLADVQLAFDLNSDGQTENIAMVTGGSGFLALDRNADGHINDGSELFGPRSGDGFADLAQYDRDGNQWIDQNDAVYEQLRVWQRDANGQDQLSTLGQVGVGALFLGRVASPFSINTATNQPLGLVRSTGLFLYESGQAGTLQHVDL